MDNAIDHSPDPEVPDSPKPLPPARGSGIYAERLLSINGRVSLIMLGWSVAIVRNPGLGRRAVAAITRRFPWFVYGSSR